MTGAAIEPSGCPIAATLTNDLEEMVAALAGDWPALAGKRIFITGGTGFIGRWMLEALAEAERRLGLATRVTILTRDPAHFAAAAPHLAGVPGFALVAGDVLRPIAHDGPFDYVIHAATDASADLNEHDPLRMFDTIVTGTRHALDLARSAGARRLLFLSSGAVYGAQPWEVEHVAEDYRGAPDLATHRSAYGEGKRAAEMLGHLYARQYGLDVINARIFALLGPLLSLDIHFAAGNFIRDAIAGRTISVDGAGTAVRSYLYAGDLAVWLWAMLLRAPAGATYNLGSEEAVSIADLARTTARLIGGGRVEILGKADAGWNPGRYVPSSAAIRRDLGVTASVGLEQAILRTARWNGWAG